MLSGLDTILRMYPIMSPGELEIMVDANSRDGRVLGSIALPEVDSPGEGYIDANIDRLFAEAGITDAASITVRATPPSGNTPTRINHQLVYADNRSLSPLASSINVSLFNPNMFTPEGKGCFIWGQVPMGPEWRSNLAIVCNRPEGETAEVEIDFYGAGGHLASRQLKLGSLGAAELDIEEVVNGKAQPDAGDNAYIWYTARSRRPDLSAFAVTAHERTGHTTGEHNF
jgi:hypothetical protein